MSTTLPCPAEGDHGAACICNGARELIVRPKSSLCPKCGDPEVARNLGCIAFQLGEYVGTACPDCGTVGDVAEYARRKKAADAATVEPVELVATSADDALLDHLRTTGLFNADAVRATLINTAAEREALHQRMRTASADERRGVLAEYDGLDLSERIAKRILAELGG